jgi:hypothetical protein
MKKIVSSLCFALLCFAASAQYVELGQMPATLATTVSTNLATPQVIDCSAQQNVAIMLSFNQSGASTSNVVYTFERSVDRNVWDTATKYTISVPSSGTTRVNYGTNINVAGFRYLRLVTIANTTALTTMTNFGVTYSVKRNAP